MGKNVISMTLIMKWLLVSEGYYRNAWILGIFVLYNSVRGKNKTKPSSTHQFCRQKCLCGSEGMVELISCGWRGGGPNGLWLFSLVSYYRQSTYLCLFVILVSPITSERERGCRYCWQSLQDRHVHAHTHTNPHTRAPQSKSCKSGTIPFSVVVLFLFNTSPEFG